MSNRHEITDIVAKELDISIGQMASDQGISETINVKVLKDAIVVTSIIKVSRGKEELLKNLVGSVIDPLVDGKGADNIRVNKVTMDRYIGSLNT